MDKIEHSIHVANIEVKVPIDKFRIAEQPEIDFLHYVGTFLTHLDIYTQFGNKMNNKKYDLMFCDIQTHLESAKYEFKTYIKDNIDDIKLIKLLNILNIALIYFDIDNHTDEEVLNIKSLLNNAKQYRTPE